MNNFSKFFYSFLAVTVIGNLTPLFMLLARVAFYTFFGSLSVLYTSTLSSYTILKWLATKFITFYEWLFHFKLPNKISIDGVHSYIPVNISKIWNTSTGYISDIKQSWIDPMFGVEHISTWDKIKTPLFIVGTVLLGFIFFDYIPYTSELIRKIPCLSTVLNTIEYIPNKIGNWIGSWFTNPTTPPAGGDNPPAPNMGNRGKDINLPSTGEEGPSSKSPWFKTPSASTETATGAGGVRITGSSYSLSQRTLGDYTRSASGYLGDLPGSSRLWGEDSDTESVDLNNASSTNTTVTNMPGPAGTGTSQTPTPSATPSHTPHSSLDNNTSSISRKR